MKLRIALLLGLMLGVAFSCTQKPVAPVLVEIDEEEVDAAISHARVEADNFVEQMLKGEGESFSVRVQIEDEGKIEHFWLKDISYQNGEFVGLICNDPAIVANVKNGQTCTVKKNDISDWLFLRDGKIHGYFSLQPMLKTMPPEEADRYRSKLANP